MKRKLISLLSLVMLLASASSAKKVHTLGDSTMAPYDEKATVTRGWGMYFGQFLTNGWTSINYAKGGRDTYSGYSELWQTAKKQVQAGDYVIITFGHNDEKNSGMDGYQLKAYYESIGDATAAAAVDVRGSIPSTTYKQNLSKIVDEVKALGAIPIICSPVCRSYFTGGKIRRNGRHDLGDSYKVLTENGPKDGTKLAEDDHTMDYAYHSQKVAEEKGISFIDLTNATKTLYESYGSQQKCEAALFDGQGSTHFNTTGALLVARECARLMKAQGILADDIVLPTDLSVSPATGDSVDEKDFSLSWPLGKGTDDATAAEVKTEGLFSVAEFDYGKLIISQQRAAGTSQQTLYKPLNNNAGSANDDDVLTFTIKPKKGLTFAPKSFSFESSKWGTGGGKFDVVAIAGGQETKLAEAFSPARNNEFSALSYDLSGLTLNETGLVLKIKVYGLASNKEYGFGKVVVTGDIQGTPEAVPSYTMSAKLGTEGAGTVSCNPAGAEFDEGTTLTVTATENFGYHFAGWTDAEGNMVSTENPYTFDIMANTELIASYTKNNVYALNMKWTGGANENLIQFLPVGNYVDGVHYYEEGTDVKITAQNNRILTFTGWEGDATGTATEYDIKMDSEKNVTANFSAADYIVGWDLYYDNPKSERAADYKADSENAGLLSLRNADGETTSWLANGIAAGLMNGKYGARVWRPLTGNYYFEISFSSKGYENLKLSASVGDDYNAHSIIFAQYSTDGGQTFKTFGTYNLPNRGWDSQEFDIPADAAGVDRLFIRFMPDYDSPMTGVESANDGTAIADIFVLADATGAASEVATLVNSNPANKATGVSRNGAVILNFDNKIKAGEGKATLNGEEIAPVISGKSAIFKYSGLAYNTAYTFSMPEGVLVSRSGKPVAATELNFTTMERQQPEAKLYDAVVAQDGSVLDGSAIKTYTTLQAAIDAAPTGRAKPWLIFVKNGRYNEHIDIPSTKTHLHIIGQNRDKTVVYDNRLCGGDNAYSVDPGATVVVKGTDTFFENITLENSYGYEKLAGPQALALNTVADRVCMNNVALLSYQDTWITSSSSTARHYIKNSLIEGAVDFIYNNGDVYLDGDTIQINRPSGGFIVAPRHTAATKWGYVFQNNIIRPRKGIDVTDVWLGRPWHDQPKTVFINTQTFINIPAKGWYNTMGGLPVLWAEYNTVDKDGNPVDLSQRETYYYYWADAEKTKKVETFNVKNTLTADEAAEYTIKNVCGGNDNWQPDLMCEACDAPVVKGEGSQLSWQAVPYAICYVVTKNGEVVGFTKETSFDGYTSADQWQVQAVNENGGLSAYATANVSTGITLQPSSISHLPSAIFTLDGRRADSSARGLLIVRDSNGIARKVIR